MPEMTALDRALDAIEHPTDMGNKTWLLCVYAPAAQTLAAEVRRLQAEQGGPCTTCQHTYSSAIGEPTCAKLRRACVYMAGGCRAWKAKP